MPDWGTFQHLNPGGVFPVATRGSVGEIADALGVVAIKRADGERAKPVSMFESMGGFEVLCAYLANSCHKRGNKKIGAAPCPACDLGLLNETCPFAGQECATIRPAAWMRCITDIDAADKGKYIRESNLEADNPKMDATKSPDDGASSMDKLSVLF